MKPNLLFLPAQWSQIISEFAFDFFLYTCDFSRFLLELQLNVDVNFKNYQNRFEFIIDLASLWDLLDIVASWNLNAFYVVINTTLPLAKRS